MSLQDVALEHGYSTEPFTLVEEFTDAFTAESGDDFTAGFLSLQR